MSNTAEFCGMYCLCERGATCGRNSKLVRKPLSGCYYNKLLEGVAMWRKACKCDADSAKAEAKAEAAAAAAAAAAAFL